jgi:Secretion system C-terminal sorting domain
MKTKLILFVLLPLCTFAQPSSRQRPLMHAKYDSIFFGLNIKTPVEKISQSTQDMKWLIDSTYTYTYSSATDSILTQKDISTLNKNGQITQYISFIKDSSNNWISLFKLDNFEYDKSGRVITDIYYQWNNIKKICEAYSKVEFAYDSNGHKTMESYYFWDTNKNQWVGSGNKTETNYDHNQKIMIATYIWDNINNIWKGQSKNEYAYDLKGNTISQITSTWINSKSTWSLSQKVESTYNINGKKLTDISFNWNSNNQLWEKHSKTQNSYDSYDNITLEMHYDWDLINSTWVDSYKYEYTYNNGKIISKVYSYFENNKWYFREKTDYLNNTSGDNTLITNYSWSFDWYTTDKMEISYDSNHKKTSEIKYIRDYESGILTENVKTEYSYDSYGNYASWTGYRWDGSDWYGDYKAELEYNSSGKRTMYAKYNSWDFEKKIFIGDSKDEYTYDINGNEIMHIMYKWDKLNNSWIGSTKTEYNNHLLPYNLPYDLTFTMYNWSNVNNQWLLSKRSYNYSSQYNVTEVENVAAEQSIKIYPNPVIEQVTIELTVAPLGVGELFDIDGHLVKTFSLIEGLNTINLCGHHSGTYILNIPTANGKVRTKLIKQ